MLPPLSFHCKLLFIQNCWLVFRSDIKKLTSEIGKMNAKLQKRSALWHEVDTWGAGGLLNPALHPEAASEKLPISSV